MSIVRCSRMPTLRAPVAIFSFDGWGDAAEASSTAVNTLIGEWDAHTFATIDPEDFYDFSEVRPRVFLDQTMTRDLHWPVGTFSYRRRPKAKNDVVLFRASEPQLRWRSYGDGILEFLEKLNVSAMVSLGSLLADTPHTRPVHVTGFATDEGLRQRLLDLSISLSQYEGPTGIIGVLHDAARRREVPSVSLWAAAPHYIAAATNPKVALTLLETLGLMMDWSLDLGTLRQETRDFEREVDSIIEANPEASAYVRRLEERSADDPGIGGPMPTSGSLIQDLEDFLRRGGDTPRGDA
ncbi:MAG TPA: PAC2 family protein [Chloroflexota bacterium]|nr:PAC2 family protein [Chloroflexota bacterium]